uniref:microtubule-severing ATPase n=1 Tax=Polytomella parva TaxID=51329 RepID=A0A7S0VEK0_9CHLO|mmetsp:Transcript_34270/g.61831  ORF Transcript_34270/g.61831 Transcript_34270/m.61831 type:complete len:572 (+) Transcript_34270:100-1815(+)|eukprot:CAMPEP_0175046254 /NCGR_PEP_ID=MMETSP0052_2-20121109/4925_1 /TAXON_ID=51329 ORGANISM="Polytomella parva, Strain SAG 63-3" /NCGR_SAMPLE_ID=MMETSP0052_2 /ASSEMBLY_ACC=CAM_ASM_000194 /LENGTH=571 /DNA_ID=CAMNT_0016309973 /DNA_START=55 /DNA_END=1770 /DNA_ORIENTATION=-
MFNFFSKGKTEKSTELSPRDKLKGYYDISKEALERAYEAEKLGRFIDASKLYHTGLDAIQEGLMLQVPTIDLGPLADSVTSWRTDLQQWRFSTLERIQMVEAAMVNGTPLQMLIRPLCKVPMSLNNINFCATSKALTKAMSSSNGMTNSIRPTIPPSPSLNCSTNQQSVTLLSTRPLSAAGALTKGAVPSYNNSNGDLNSKYIKLTNSDKKVSVKTAEGTVHTAPLPGASSPIYISPDDPLKKYKEQILTELLEEPASPAPASSSPSPLLPHFSSSTCAPATRRIAMVHWDDVLGLDLAKQALREAVVLPSLRPDLFQGLRAPIRGVLLYGPPGNGKTLLGRALAAESRASFFCISASSLTSKWLGDGEKMVRALFEVAAAVQPAIIFIDEADSLLSMRGKSNENEASRRLLTEFLVQFDGVAGTGKDRVVVVAATNRPWELDDAVRRRLAKRIYVPLPNERERSLLLEKLLKGTKHSVTSTQLMQLARRTRLFSCSDLAALAKDAAMAPLREIPMKALALMPADRLRSVSLEDFETSLRTVKASASQESLEELEKFTRLFGGAGGDATTE